jgi:bifunctional N-acetylglucosamine-1-phosphate-uridyltransferase/glucosamine-1-phosphate-acetyltransferase GlmU-like protein
MKVVRDCFGRSVRLTDERVAHILQHQEMTDMAQEIERVLQSPTEVRISRSDEAVRLFYEFYAKTMVGGKWLCVVVKYAAEDAFVVTAYLTDQLKAGDTIWPKK